MQEFIFGTSAKGRDIVAYLFNEDNKNLPIILIIATVHGDEVEGLWLADYFKTVWRKKFPYENVRCLLIPKANPDGFLSNTRLNGNNVDLNRNLPTKDWDPKAFNERYPPGPFAGSEPENQALVKLIEEYKPKGIFSLHSFKDPQINANGGDETGVMDLAKALYKVSPYKKITRGDEMGYPTPGCLGTYAGYERGIPTITYELLRGDSFLKIMAGNMPVVRKVLSHFDAKFQKNKFKQ
jgi:protein MpaA